MHFADRGVLDRDRRDARVPAYFSLGLSLRAWLAIYQRLTAKLRRIVMPRFRHRETVSAPFLAVDWRSTER
jgi:hypothetical protein